MSDTFDHSKVAFLPTVLHSCCREVFWKQLKLGFFFFCGELGINCVLDMHGRRKSIENFQEPLFCIYLCVQSGSDGFLTNVSIIYRFHFFSWNLVCDKFGIFLLYYIMLKYNFQSTKKYITNSVKFLTKSKTHLHIHLNECHASFHIILSTYFKYNSSNLLLFITTKLMHFITYKC